MQTVAGALLCMLLFISHAQSNSSVVFAAVTGEARATSVASRRRRITDEGGVQATLLAEQGMVITILRQSGDG